MNRLPVFILSILLVGLALGFIGCSEEDSGPTAPTLSAPTDLVATALTETQIALSWANENAYIAGYKIQRAMGTDGSFTEIKQIDQDLKTYTDSSLSEGSMYRYKVLSFTRNAESPLSSEASATTLPIAPSNLIAERISGSQIDLSWTDNSAAEENFEVQISLRSNADFDTVATLDSDVVEYSAKNLVENTRYYFRVRATLGAGTSKWTNVAQATTTVHSPAAPTNLTAETISSSEIALNWLDKSHNEKGFVIELSLTGAGDWTPRDSVGINQTDRRRFTVGRLTGLTTYYFRVYAYNDSGPSPLTNIASATTIQGPPLMPQNLVVRAPDFSHVELSWTDASQDEIGFILERKHVSSSWGQVDSLAENTSSFNDDQILPLNRYMYRICSVNAASRSLWLTSDWITVPDGPPMAPTDLQATPLDMNRINLGWTDASNNEGGFVVERRLSGAGEFAVIADLGAGVEVYGDTGLEQETAYDYRVKAIRDDQVGHFESDYSDIVSATTFGPLSTPVNLVATPMNSQAIVIRWQDQSFAETGQVVERTLEGENNFVVLADDVAANITLFVDSGLEESTAYSYRVKAFIDDGGNVEESDYSNIATAETFSRIVVDQGFEEFEVGAPPPEESGWGPMLIGGNARLTVSDERAMAGGSNSLYFQDPHGSVDNVIRVIKEHRQVVRSHVSFNVFVPSFDDACGIRGWNQNGNLAWQIQFMSHPQDGNIVAVSNGVTQDQRLQLTYTRNFPFPLGEWVNIEVITNSLTNTCDVLINGAMYANQYLYHYMSISTIAIEFICFTVYGDGSEVAWEQLYVDDVFIEEIADENAAFEMPNLGPVRDRCINIYDTQACRNLQAR